MRVRVKYTKILSLMTWSPRIYLSTIYTKCWCFKKKGLKHTPGVSFGNEKKISKN